MELSIVIVNYNTAKLTLECIASIKKYSPKFSFEIIVVDNGSDEKLKLDGKDVRVIRNDSNTGFAKANNQGIDIAKGKYILLLNSDTKVKPETLDRLVDFAEKTHDAGVVAPRLLNSDGSIQNSVFRLPTVWRTIRQYWLGEKGVLDKYAPRGIEVVEEAVMAAYLITPMCLKKVGKLDERYFFYFEDFAYARKIKELGLKIYYLPTSEVVHYHGASGTKIADSANQWRRLVPSSKIYHGIVAHYLIFFITWSSQKWKKLLNLN